MDADDIRRKLEEAGIPTDAWASSPGGARPAPASILRQATALRAMKAHLEAQAENFRAQAAELREQRARLKHGGGR